MTIHKIITEDFEDFWQKISPISGIAKRSDGAIFRGQGNSDWKLVPSVNRGEIYNKYCSRSFGATYVNKTLLEEFITLKAFVDELDNIGYSIPSDSQNFRNFLDKDVWDKFGKDVAKWPTPELYPLLALAQHHGIPTCLLDWSRNPIVAAYFAVSQWLMQPNKDEISHLTIWILISKDLHVLDGRLEIINMPGSTSVNLSAQKGCFTVFRSANPRNRCTQIEFDELENELEEVINNEKGLDVYKINLPAKYAVDLFDRCLAYGFSAATLFPSVDGAARAALEAKLIDQTRRK